MRACLGLLLVGCLRGAVPAADAPAEVDTPPPPAGRPAGREDPAEAKQGARRAALVAELRSRGVSEVVLGALGRVPRHHFVAARFADEAYDDRPLPIEAGQTISQPFGVARMPDLLQLRPGARVLEVGTGSGYQAAVLAELGAQVWSIELEPLLARTAAERLTRLGYRAVRVRQGDGYAGWPTEAPFDAIIVTAAPPEVPAPLLEQLSVGARLVLPVGDHTQELLAITRTKDHYLRQRDLPVRFVPMRGEAQKRRDGGAP